MQAKDVITELVPIYSEIITLTEDAKEILSKAKDADLDATMLSKIAKAKAAMKLGELEAKTAALVKLLDEVS